jgi:hypothetical protein
MALTGGDRLRYARPLLMAKLPCSGHGSSSQFDPKQSFLDSSIFMEPMLLD